MLVLEAGYDLGISNPERQNLAELSSELTGRGMLVIEAGYDMASVTRSARI